MSGVLAQAAAVLPASIWLTGPVFQGWLPGPLDTAATVLLWLWFVNLFNFMDGIDGISGIEAGFVGGGAALIAWLAPEAGLDPVYGLTLAAAALCTITGKCNTFDVSAMADRHDHVFALDQVFDIGIELGFLDRGPPRCCKLFLHRLHFIARYQIVRWMHAAPHR